MAGSGRAAARHVLAGVLLLAGVAVVWWWLSQAPAHDRTVADIPPRQPVTEPPQPVLPDVVGRGEAGFEGRSAEPPVTPERLAPDAAATATVLVARVVTPTGRPAAGAIVMLERVGSDADATPARPSGRDADHVQVADNDGGVRVESIEAGSWTIIALLPGCSPAVLGTDVSAGGLTTVVVALPRPAVLTGTVRDSVGRPLGNAKVRVGDPGTPLGQEAESDGDGRYTLDDLLAGEEEVIVLDQAGTKLTARVELVPGVTTTFDPVLPRGHVLEGLLLDDRGTPAPGLELQAKGPEEMRSRGQIAITDRSGRFLFTNLLSGPQSIFLAPNREETALHVLLAGDVMPDTPDLVLRVPQGAFLPGRLSGRFAAPGGPAGALRLQIIEPASGRRWPAPVDPHDGRFESLDLPAGLHELHVLPEEHAAAVFGPFALAGGSSLDAGVLELQPGGRLRIRLPDAWARVSCQDSAARVQVEVSPGSVERTSDVLAPGEWIIRARSSRFLPAESKATVIAGQTTDVVLEVDPGVEQSIVMALDVADSGKLPAVHLTVRDDAGEPAWDSREERSPTSLFGKSGLPPQLSWSVRLRPGRYVVDVETEGRRWRVDGLQADEREPWRLDGD